MDSGLVQQIKVDLAKSISFMLCVEPDKSAYCGNFRVEKGEECDNGNAKDKCCADNCKLVTNAKCR